MKATVVLLGTVEEQANDRDGYVIAPEAVKLPEMPMVLWANMSYRVPDDVIGSVERVWVEDGRLMAEVEIHPMHVATSFMDVVKPSLLSVGLVNKPRG